jgi:hypothetical protein
MPPVEDRLHQEQGYECRGDPFQRPLFSHRGGEKKLILRQFDTWIAGIIL